MKPVYFVLIILFITAVGAQSEVQLGQGNDYSESLRVSQGEDFNLSTSDFSYESINATLSSSFGEVRLNFTRVDDSEGEIVYESNSSDVQNLLFGNNTVEQISARDGEETVTEEITNTPTVEVEDAIEGSGRQRWYNSIILSDLTNREASYIAGVPFSGIEQGIDGPITAKEVSTRYRVLALENGWLQESYDAIINLNSDASNLEDGSIYLSPQTNKILPHGGLGGNTPNREKISAEEAEQYENHDVEDYCYTDVAYRPPPYSGDESFDIADFGSDQNEIVSVPSVSGGLEAANAEAYECPSITAEQLPEDESELEDPMTYCPSGMSEDTCIDLRIEPSCQEHNRDALCASILGDGPGASAVLWQRYCYTNYNDSPINLNMSEKIACIGPSYNKTASEDAPRTNQFTKGEIVRSFCESTPLTTYNSENNICEIGY